METRSTHKLSLLDIIENECRNSAGKAALVQRGANRASDVPLSLSYASAWRCIQQHRTWLKEKILQVSRTDIQHQDVCIAYLSSNSIDMLLSLIACTDRNLIPDCHYCVAALLNVRWTPQEMANVLKSLNPQTSITIIVHGEDFGTVAERVSRQLNHESICLPIPNFSMEALQSTLSPTQPDDSNRDDLRRLRISDVEKRGDDGDAMIVFTSGTTGGSKGVRLGHRALAIQSLAKLSEPCNYSSETVMLASTVPLFHVGGISSCLAVLFAGGTLVFPPRSEPHFDPGVVKSTLETQILPTNTLVMVPAMLVALLAEMKTTSVYPFVRLILIGGQSASKHMINRLSAIFPNARIVQTYACTEAASSLTFLHINFSSSTDVSLPTTAPNGDCVGSPPSHVHLRLYRKEGKVTKIVTSPYRPGIIATRGSHVMNGYWERGSSEPATNLRGWYLTTDLGFFDQSGQLYFCGRVKDVIRSGGETVMAQEVERVLLRNPAIVECAVFPRLDDRFGEAVACAVVTKTPLQLGNVKEWCQEQGLASYKRPRFLFLVDSLPKNSSGKVLKHELVAMYGKLQSKL